MNEVPTLYHFNCTVCGSHPTEIGLREFLDEWQNPGETKLISLLGILLSITTQLKKNDLISRPMRLAESIHSLHGQLLDQGPVPLSAPPHVLSGRSVRANFHCPYCNTDAGERPVDRYFTVWENACKVQTANLFYEVGMVLNHLSRLESTNPYNPNLRLLADKCAGVQAALDLAQCPVCGRYTTGLFGTGSRASPVRCRWCSDLLLYTSNVAATEKSLGQLSQFYARAVPGFTPSVSDPRPEFVIHFHLPVVAKNLNPETALHFWERLVQERHAVTKEAVDSALVELVNRGVISEFRDLSPKSSYYRRAIAVTAADGTEAKVPIGGFAPYDFSRPLIVQYDFVRYEIDIPDGSRHQPPRQRLPEADEEFRNIKAIPSPWRFKLVSADVQKGTNHQTYSFRGFIEIQWPLIAKRSLANHRQCKHQFRSFDLGTWEWRLVWECQLCGFHCYCNCFRQAIVEQADRRVFLERYGRKLPMRVSELPFVSGACDVCRGAPSTNRFCADMYARSLFEARYGAYVRKKMIELQTERGQSSDEKQLEVLANNLVRRQLGFPAIGEEWVTETELYRVVRHLFPSMEVIHHSRPKWLEGLELDVFVPKAQLGIEYQGEQHYVPVKHWGGEEALEKTKNRDARKGRLCKANGVRLIHFKYTEEITVESVALKLIDNGVTVSRFP